MEDAYAVSHFPQGTLAVVCDGMGGHSHGDLAARAAADAFCAAFARLEGLETPQRLRGALDEANAAVGALLVEQGGEFGGTTLLAAYVTHHLLYHVSVGDSALFLWRGNTLSRLNEDHSMRPYYQGVGPACALLPDSHCLRSALSGDSMELVDAPQQGFPLLPHDRIILASDGVEELLSGCTPTQAVRRILSSTDTPLAPALVQAVEALHYPFADNVTVLTMDAE